MVYVTNQGCKIQGFSWAAALILNVSNRWKWWYKTIQYHYNDSLWTCVLDMQALAAYY